METYIENLTDFDTVDFEDTVRTVINESLRYENILFDCEISVTFVSEYEIKTLNNKYRDMDSVTDVLSFPLLNGKSDIIALNEKNAAYPIALGDIAICVSRAVEQATAYGHSILREIGFLTAHSMLHLLGYDHSTKPEEAEMFKKQEEILSNINIIR